MNDRGNKILLIIPAYNEAENIERVVDALVRDFPQFDYVVVDDGSQDDTLAICRHRGYNVIGLPVNMGLATAVQTGFQYAYYQGYGYAIQFDGDGQHRPEYVEDMRVVLDEQQADIVIGSRFLDGGRPPGLKALGSWMISAAIKLTTGKRITDPTSGMRMVNRRMIREFAFNFNYIPEPDTISFLIKNGVKVVECQVRMDDRVAGESYLGFWQSGKYMLRTCLSIFVLQGFRKREA